MDRPRGPMPEGEEGHVGRDRRGSGRGEEEVRRRRPCDDVATFVASTRVETLETRRVPYAIDRSSGPGGLHRFGLPEGAGLLWPPVALLRDLRPRDVTEARGLGAVLHEQAVPSVLPRGSWAVDRETSFTDADGSAWHAWVDEKGNVFVPFDFDAARASLLGECYCHSRPLLAVARRLFYVLKPLLPRSLQICMRRRFTAVQESAAFPRWPAEDILHALDTWIWELACRATGTEVPWIHPWPDGYKWCLSLTHDVERARGYANVRAVLEVEGRHGVTSAWLFVPERDYRVDEELLTDLRARGCEIGLHGLRHDGRDLRRRVFPRRLPAMRRYAESWQARGFRAPSTLRDRTLLPQLGLDWDSSYSDVARYEPKPGGTCAFVPFFIDDLVELPITLPMDHTLFEILGQVDATPWIGKASWLRERRGLALMLTHPDYLLDETRLGEYARFLGWVSSDDTCWRALPSEVARWWRDRASTTLVRRDGAWHPVGPGAPRARVMTNGLPDVPGVAERQASSELFASCSGPRAQLE